MYVYLISLSVVWLRDLLVGLVSSKSQRTASWDFDVQASRFMARRLLGGCPARIKALKCLGIRP